MQQSNQYEIVIIQCCQNCDSHQSITKHSQWKYYEHFNQLKKKIQRYVAGAIVIKNPVPDQLHQPSEVKLEKNTYLNKHSQQQIIFPRIGSFEIYIYNILISSKLTSNSWPNHYKILQTLNQIINAKKQGLSLEQFSIYQGQQPNEQTSFQKKEKKAQSKSIPKKSHETKQVQQRRKIVSKKKTGVVENQGSNRFRVYKSKEPKMVTIDKSLNKNSAILDPLSRQASKNIDAIQVQHQAQKKALKNASLRYIQSKNENRVKLPSLKNTLNMLNSSQNRKNIIGDTSIDEKPSRKIFNTIEGSVFDKDEMSIIEKDPEMLRMLESSDKAHLSMNRFDSLVLYNNEDSILGIKGKAQQSPVSHDKWASRRKHPNSSRNQPRQIGSQNDLNEDDQENDQLIDELDDMRVVENRSIQYSEMKEYMTRAIQYEQNSDFYADHGVQIDDNSCPRDIMVQFVQTDHVEFKQLEKQEQSKKQLKPYMLDESVQANIVIKKKQKTRQVQTFVPELISTQINTDMKEILNRGIQFPDQDEKNQFPIELDSGYIHLFQKRRNLPIQENQKVYSIDRFQQKTTKYKWIGKAFEETQFKLLKRKLLLQAMVFAVYNFFGIKTPEKRIAFLQCSNIIGQKITSNNSAMYHLLSEENPEIHFFNQFEELNVNEKIFPLSEEITYRNSKQKVKFNNWGKFLALVYFLDDNGVFDNSSARKNPREKLFENQSSPNSINQSQSPRQIGTLFPKYASSIGLVITNEEVKDIYRLSCQNYELFVSSAAQIQNQKSSLDKEELIYLTSNKKQIFIDPKRLSKSVQSQLISMLSRLTMEKTFTELKHYLKDVFINRSKVYDGKFLKLFQSIQKYEHLEMTNETRNRKSSIKKNVYNSLQNEQSLIKMGVGAEMDEMQELLKTFIDKLQHRYSLISQSFKGKIYCYRKYNSLEAKISYSLSANPVIQRILQVSYIANSQKPQSEYKVQIQDITKMLKTNSNVLFLTGQEGSGKSYLLQKVKNNLSANDKYNVLHLQNIQKVEEPKKFIDNKFQYKKKNIILIDNLNNQKDAKLFVKLIKGISSEKQDKFDISYLCVLKNSSMFDPLTLKLNSLINRNISRQQKFINLKMQPLSDQNIKYYISKTVDFKNVTQKNQLSQKIINSLTYTPALRNPLYLNLYCQIIQTDRLDEFIAEYDPIKINKWWIMKKTFDKCKVRHKTQLDEMGIQMTSQKDIYFELRQLVMQLHVMDCYPEYYRTIRKPQKDKSLTTDEAFVKLQEQKLQLIQELFNEFQEDHDRLVKSHLQFYPVDTKYLVKIKTEKAHLMLDDNQDMEMSVLMEKNDQQSGDIKLEDFFVHTDFFQYLLVEAYSYYLSKGFKNLQINDIVLEPHLLSLIREKAHLEPSFTQQLLRLIYDTQTYPALSEQGSNAMTLLSYLNFQFSNLIFDHCQLQHADISLTTFYNCSFRDTNLMNATIYKTSFLNCAIDATIMDNVNLLVKKYQIEFTPLCCAISRDAKQIVLGCGNYLVVLSTQTGKQLKKIEAHLDVIRSVKFSKDGQYLITIADDKTLRTWDTHNFKSVVFKLPQKGGAVFFSNQSQTIATVVNKNDLKVWNIKSMANQALFEGHTDQITSVNFSLNGEYIITGSKDTTIRLWNLKGKQLHVYKGHDKEIICTKISPTNAIIASSSKQKLLILFQTLTETIAAKKVFSNEIIEICLDLKEIYICCAFAHDQKISILSFTSLEIIHQLQGHHQKIISINFDTSFEKLISLSKDRTVRLWDLEKIMQKELPLQQLYKAQKTPQGPALSIAYSKKLSQYATGHENGQINIWDDQTDKIIYKLTDHHGYVTRLQFDLSGKLYSGGKDGMLRIWNFQKFQDKKNQPYRKLELFSCEIVDLKINDKNKIIVMSSMNNQLVVYDFTGIKMIMSTRDEGKINAIAFDEKDRYMAIGGGQKYIATFKIQNQGNTITRSQELGEHPESISSLAYQGESLLISVLKNGHIYIWNHMRVMLIKKIENMSPINCLSIYNKIFGCLSSEDGKIRIINLDEGKEVKVFKYRDACVQFVTRFASTSNGSNEMPLMYAACKDGNIIKWNLNDMKKANKKSSILFPSITQQQKKVNKFGRKAVNQEGTIMAQVEGEKFIKIKNLNEHTQELIKIDKCPSQIEGLEFMESSSHEKGLNIKQNLMVLLKSGQFWSLKSNSIYEPSSNDSQGSEYMNGGNLDGDLVYSKNRENLFFKSGIKKVSKQIKKPSQLIVDQMTIGN